MQSDTTVGAENSTERAYDDLEELRCSFVLCFVILRNGLTVEMFTYERDFEKGKNDRKIIDDGRINLY